MHRLSIGIGSQRNPLNAHFCNLLVVTKDVLDKNSKKFNLIIFLPAMIWRFCTNLSTNHFFCSAHIYFIFQFRLPGQLLYVGSTNAVHRLFKSPSRPESKYAAATSSSLMAVLLLFHICNLSIRPHI